MRRGAVVDVAMLAIEAFATESLHIYRNAVARLYALNVATYLFNHAHHLVSYGNALYGTWHASVLDV